MQQKFCEDPVEYSLKINWSNLISLADCVFFVSPVVETEYKTKLHIKTRHLGHFSSPCSDSSFSLLSPTRGSPWPCWSYTGPSGAAGSNTRSETAQIPASGGSRGGTTRQCPTLTAAAVWAQWRAGSPLPRQRSEPHSARTHWISHWTTAGAGCWRGRRPFHLWQPPGCVREPGPAPSRPAAGPGCQGRRGAPSASSLGSGPETRRASRRLPDCRPPGWVTCWRRDCRGAAIYLKKIHYLHVSSK